MYPITFLKRLVQPMTRLSYIFFVPVKENNGCGIDWLVFITGNPVVYLFSLMLITKDKWSKNFWFFIRMGACCLFVLCLLPKTRNPILILIPFLCQSIITVMHLFECIYQIEMSWVWVHVRKRQTHATRFWQTPTSILFIFMREKLFTV